MSSPVVTSATSATNKLSLSTGSDTKKPATAKNRLIDIDGTVSEDIPNEESHRFSEAYLLKGAVEGVNAWHDAGDFIVFFTARKEEHRKVTEDWLNSKGFRYHALVMNKPRGGNYYWLDNLDGEYEKFESWETVKG